MVQGMTPSKHPGLTPVRMLHPCREYFADIRMIVQNAKQDRWAHQITCGSLTQT